MGALTGLVTRARAEVGQVVWWLRDHRDADRRAHNRIVRAGLELPELPRRRRVAGEIWAVTMVKDEVDVIAATVAHLFRQGIDHVLVADNGSSDGTLELLRELAASDPRVHVAIDREPAYYQSEKMTQLALAAVRSGADWIVPFDADEFWFAAGRTVGELLRGLAAAQPAVGMVRAHFHNMIPVREVSDLVSTEFVMDSSPLRPGKVAVRSHPLMVISVGNHGASRVGAIVDGLRIAHAAYRSPAQVARKVRQGAVAVNLTNPGDDMALHWRAASLLTDDEVADVWARISSGESDERLKYRVAGPMVLVRPLLWATWDPDGVVPETEPHLR